MVGRANGQPMEDENPKRRPWVVYLLCTIPLWLALSGGVGIWGYFRTQKAEERKEAARFATVVSASSMADDFHKLAVVIGARNSSVDAGRGLTRTASWIEGILGPSNTGYAVQKVIDPEIGTWPILRVDLRGVDEKAAPLWIVTAYDSPNDEAGIADASSAVVSMIAAAQAIAGEKPHCPLRFVFLPHGNESSPLVAPTETRLIKMIREEGAAASILSIGNMRGGEGISLATEDATNHALSVVQGLGEVLSAARSEGTVAGRLDSEGLPAVAVASVAAHGAANEDSEADILASSTGRMVELVRRLMVRK